MSRSIKREELQSRKNYLLCEQKLFCQDLYLYLILFHFQLQFAFSCLGITNKETPNSVKLHNFVVHYFC